MMDDERIESMTQNYIRSYKIALQEVKNPNLAQQIAASIALLADMQERQEKTQQQIQNAQQLNPLAALFFAATQAKQRENEKQDQGKQEDPEK